jgi:hypothetical protein
MSGELAQLSAKMDMVITMLGALVDQQKASMKPMTQVAFAKRVGLSRWTIKARIDRGEIITKGGKIPPTELRKFGL